jgi:hypothetical protein
VKAANLQIRGLRPDDRTVLGRFTCSTGKPWEDLVEEQIRGPLPLRYLDTPPYFDGRMLLGFGPAGDLLVVGAHHIEPSMVPDVGYRLRGFARGDANYGERDSAGGTYVVGSRSW